MKLYLAVFFSQGRYRHLTADSPQEAWQLLIDFTIDRPVEPVGVYDSLTNRFTDYSTKTTPNKAFTNDQRGSPNGEVQLYIDCLRKRALTPVNTDQPHSVESKE